MRRITIFALLLAFTAPCFAEVPKLISFSGKLVNKNGEIVADNNYDMRFSLWTQSSGGTEEWVELHSGLDHSVPVKAGSFNVILGNITELLDLSKNYFLETRVDIGGTWEIFGRQQLISVPYALKVAQDAVMPVGSIIAWHKTVYNKLPADWVECNGGTVPAGVGSPIEGQPIPNLNSEGRFLRGGSVSGTYQADELRAHSHSTIAGNLTTPRDEWHVMCDWTNKNEGPADTTTVTGGSETRPVNMSVVWIMKIK